MGKQPYIILQPEIQLALWGRKVKHEDEIADPARGYIFNIYI